MFGVIRKKTFLGIILMLSIILSFVYIRSIYLRKIQIKILKNELYQQKVFNKTKYEKLVGKVLARELNEELYATSEAPELYQSENEVKKVFDCSQNQIPQSVYKYIDELVGEDNFEMPECSKTEKKFNFVFLKNHKCASDTLSAIGRRFALLRDLSILLPLGARYLLGWPYQPKSFMYRPPKTALVNVILDHMVYNRTFLLDLMPPDTVYFTIIRQPIRRLMSAVHYFGVGPCTFMPYKIIQPELIAREFLKDMVKYDQMFKSVSNFYKKKHCNCIPKGVSMVRNAMAFDLGFPHEFHIYGSDQSQNYTFIKEWLVELHKEMDFVMITEYFNTSLVFLKRYMCWDTKDILYLRVNDWRHTFPEYPKDHVEKFQNWTNVDALLYTLFNKTLHSRVAKLGQDFQNEVVNFEKQCNEVVNFCRKMIRSDKQDKMLKMPKTKWSAEYRITHLDCTLIFDKKHLRDHVKDAYDKNQRTATFKYEKNPGFIWC